MSKLARRDCEDNLNQIRREGGVTASRTGSYIPQEQYSRMTFYQGQVFFMTGITPAPTHLPFVASTSDNHAHPPADKVESLTTLEGSSGDIALPPDLAKTASAELRPLGNLGGALSWSIPLSPDEQRRLRLVTMSHQHHLGDQPLVMQTKGGVLEFLNYFDPIPIMAQHEPAKMLEALVGSPQGQLMGKALQHKMQGMESDSSVTDYLLAGIALQMDPESIFAPDRNKIAGFDLASEQYWGEAPRAVVDGLAEHLRSTGRTSAAMAQVGARILIARIAPSLLIQKIPPNVTIGSQAWANVTIAAMTIEALHPGKVLDMTFAQVMSDADQFREIDTAATQRTQTVSVLDWAIANGVIKKTNDDTYTVATLEAARNAFNAQLDERLTASSILTRELPTRREIALTILKNRFGDLGALFEVKALSTDIYRGESGQRGFAGTHSLLDYAMMDLPNLRPLTSSDARLPLDAVNDNPTFGVLAVFEEQFATAIREKKSAVATTIRHMIAQLPLADRKTLQFAKLTFFQETSYTSDGFFNNSPEQKEPWLLLRTELRGNFQAYEINFEKGTIAQANLYRAKSRQSRDANKYFATKELKPRDTGNDLDHERSSNDSLLNSFHSARARCIADVFLQHLDLDDPAIKQLARGQTPLDAYFAPRPLNDFLLNLIPFRSAIVNLKAGSYGEAAFDLLVDVFGFLTAGAATAGKLLKIGRTAVSAGARVLRSVNVIGVSAIEMLNPVSGLGDLARLVGVGGLYVVSKGARAINRLRGAAASYDVLKAVSKQYDAAAIGGLNVAGQKLEVAAVLRGGHWYAFDADSMRPFGSALDQFNVATQAVAGHVSTAHIGQAQALSHKRYGRFAVPESRIAGLTRNTQGVYVAADGHLSHIRHTDHRGRAAVYEVRQIARTEDGFLQARVYHENRQTELLVQHLQGDQWQRLGVPGGGEITAEHLRTWEALPVEEQSRLTRQGFARQNRLSVKTFEHYVNADGQLSETGVLLRDRAAGTPFNEITATRIQSWQNMTQLARDAMTMDGFAAYHHLNPRSFRSYVRLDGSLGPMGESLMFRAGGGTYDKITDAHLVQWKVMLEQPANSLTANQFQMQHRLDPQHWAKYVNHNGSLKEAAVRRLARASPAAARTGQGNIQRISAADLQTWQALSSEEQLRLTRKGFAREHHLSVKTFEHCVQPDGQLSATGVLVRDRPADAPFNEINEVHIRSWQNMTQQARDAMTTDGFAAHHHVNLSTFRTYIRPNGVLTPSGESLLFRFAGGSYNPITDEHIRQWTRLLAQADGSVAQEAFLRQHGLNPNLWKFQVKPDGSLREATAQRLQRAQPSHQLPPVQAPGVRRNVITAEHLRAWEALAPEEQRKLGPQGFAQQHHLSLKTFDYYVQPDGQLSTTGVLVRDRPASTPFNKVTAMHIQTWRGMTAQMRDVTTLEGFAGQYHLHPSTLKNYLQTDGRVTSMGEALLFKAGGGTYNPITDEHLRQWSTLFASADNSVTAEQFVSRNRLNPLNWTNYVKANGSLKDKTRRRLDRAGANTTSPSVGTETDAGAKKQTITAEHLRAWEALPPEEQLEITRKGFAHRHNLAPKTFEYYVQPEGQLSAAGVIVRDRLAALPFNEVSEVNIRRWQGMTQQARDAMTLQGYAGLHHLNPGTFRSYVRRNGSLGPDGEALLNRLAGRTYNLITDDHLRQWRTQLGKADNSVTSAQFMRQHQFNPVSWGRFVDGDGSLKEAAVSRLDRAQHAAAEQADTTRKRPATDPLDPPLKSARRSRFEDPPQDAEIPGPSSAVEPDVVEIVPGGSRPLRRHQIDNTLPILQDPANPRLSLTRSLEGPIDEIRIAYWNGLLDGLDSATKERVSTQIKASIKDWLRTEGQHQSRFDECLKVVAAMDDDGPARGACVCARRDIPQFEVLGPYAGKYHPSEASLFQEQRKQGSEAVLTYIFGTRSGRRTVSGLHTGNTLSLINTSQLKNGPVWKSNNVTSISVGKNLTFYVALSDIKKGDELLLDYGPFYQPVPDIAIKPDPGR